LEERARPPSPSSGTGAPAAAGADGLRLRDVEAAAAEAGISRQFVALAVAEMTAAARGGAQAAPPKELAQWQDVVATILLGSTGRSVAASRTVPAAPRRVLQAVGRVLRAPPFSLSLRDAPGRHPLDGGVLVFDLPELGGTRQSYPWTYTRYGVRARQLQVTLRPLPHDPNACEVQLHVDIRQGLRANVIATSALTGFFTGGGGAAGLFVAVEKFALAGAALGLPALGAAVVAGGVSLAVLRASYRREIRKTVAEMESALAAVMASIRTDEIFE
ncbi:MAG TPA: hypothetical protein VKA84_27510, partial [Gemmatimonadaceae bacterium]|nr:hypothetical protein [Gemmatimonadaceae bacterium]